MKQQDHLREMKLPNLQEAPQTQEEKQLRSFRKTNACWLYWAQEPQAARSAETLGQAQLLESCL